MSKSVQVPAAAFDQLVTAICHRLSEKKPVRRMLPGGRIHIDRPLPFLCVYRQPPTHDDDSTRRLVMGEASYLIASGEPSFQPALHHLLTRVVETLSGEFGAFLIIEIWAGTHASAQGGNREQVAPPGFRLLTKQGRYGALASTLLTLERALQEIKVLKVPAEVVTLYRTAAVPPDCPPLLTPSEMRTYRCQVIGLEVRPVYLGAQPGDVFPLVLQTVHRGVAQALKRAVFECVQVTTTYRSANYQTLGRRAVVKAVWEADRQLAAIGNAFDFLLLVTPVNVDAAWVHFRRTRFQQPPLFQYRPIPADPGLLKRQLHAVPLERIEDPTLAHLFREKQAELEQRLTMLTHRGTRRLLFGYLQLYGEVQDSLVSLARDLLERIPPASQGGDPPRYLSAKEFAARATAEIEHYRNRSQEFRATAQVRDDVSGNIVVRGNLLIGKSTKVPPARAEALIQHEVGTHLLTYFNGRAQPFRQLANGLAGFEELQEGLAVLSEYFVGGLTAVRLRTLAARVLAVKSLTDGRTFVDTFHMLSGHYHFSPHHAFQMTMRVFRGGGLTKDIIYLRGLLNVVDHLKAGGELELLFLGKMAVRHVPLIKELLHRKIIRPAAVHPRYMESAATIARLKRLREGLAIHDMLQGGAT